MVCEHTEESNKTNIAILLATYNGGKYLQELLDSLLKQTYRDFICYVHDDGSTDNTEDILNQYIVKYPNMIISVSGASCGEAKANFLFLLEKVEADYYMFCDQDDVWVETKIADSLKAIKEGSSKKPKCIYTDLQVVDEELKVIDASFYGFTQLDPQKNSLQQLLMSNVCVGCTMIINRALRDTMLELKSNNIIMHDWEAALVTALVGEIKYLDKATILYRQHGNNTIGATKEMAVWGKLLRAINSIPEYVKRQVYYRERPRKMAEDLLQIHSLNDKDRLFLLEMSTIADKNKYKRVRFYQRNDLFRQRISKIWQLCWV